MNKKEFLDFIMKNVDGENFFKSRQQTQEALKLILEGFKQALKKEEKVQLIGFGTFMVKERKARKGLNPRTREEIKIPATKTVAFRPGKNLKEYVAAKKAVKKAKAKKKKK